MTTAAGNQGGCLQRRRWSKDEKLRIVAESFEPGASVSVVARRHDLNANLLFTWRRRYGSAGPGAESSSTLVPAIITNDPVAAPSVPSSAAGCATAGMSVTGRMEIVLPGGYRLIIDNDVNTAVLGRVIKALLHR